MASLMGLATAPPQSALLLPAAGSGQRVGATANKLLLPLCGEPLLVHTLRAVAAAEAECVVLVTRPDERAAMAELAEQAGCSVEFADGGDTRQDSVAAGLAVLADTIDVVAVHDAARPLVEPALLVAALRQAREHGSAVAAVPVADTLAEVIDGAVVGNLDRSRAWAMQTPQAFRADWLRQAHRQAAQTGTEATDEAGLVAQAGYPVRVVRGSRLNFKVTEPDDLILAEAVLSARRGATMEESGTATANQHDMTDSDLRIGFGYDVHRLEAGRALWLGGERVPSEVGLVGHSDADVLLHAICDALLGAIGAGDIGLHFPDTDPRFAGIASLRLLDATWALVSQAGYRLVNLDATVVAERPKLAPHRAAMTANIAAALSVTPTRINIKATTHERLGALGAGQGIAAHAVACLAPTAPPPIEE